MDADEFNRLTHDQKIAISHTWNQTRILLQKEFPTRRNTKLDIYINAGFGAADSFEVKALETIMEIAKQDGNDYGVVKASTIYDFLKGKFTQKTLNVLMRIFEPLATSEYIITTALGERRRPNYNGVDADFCDAAALSVISKFDAGRYLSYGPAIIVREFGEDVFEHGQIGTAGISPHDMSIQFFEVPFDNFSHEELIDRDFLKFLVGKGETNNPKYSLERIEPEYDMKDQGNKIELRLQRSNYYTVRSCVARIGNSEDARGRTLDDRSALRAKYGSPIPTENQVPNALCLHYIVRFADGCFLAIHRHAGMAYDKLKVSVSGEEQFSHKDFGVNPQKTRAERWAHRAVIEEVMPGRAFDVEAKEVQDLIDQILHTRFMSILYEERFCNFAVVAFIQLKCTVEQYKVIYHNSLIKCQKVDFEGNRYWFHPSQVDEFFATGRLCLMPFSDTKHEIIAVTNDQILDDGNTFGLHTSSLYRLHIIRRLLGG